MIEWIVTVDFTSQYFTPDASLDLSEALGTYGAATAINPDESGGSLTVTITATNSVQAVQDAIRLLTQQIPNATVTGIEAKPWKRIVHEKH